MHALPTFDRPTWPKTKKISVIFAALPSPTLYGKVKHSSSLFFRSFLLHNHIREAWTNSFGSFSQNTQNAQSGGHDRPQHTQRALTKTKPDEQKKKRKKQKLVLYTEMVVMNSLLLTQRASSLPNRTNKKNEKKKMTASWMWHKRDCEHDNTNFTIFVLYHFRTTFIVP